MREWSYQAPSRPREPVSSTDLGTPRSSAGSAAAGPLNITALSGLPFHIEDNSQKEKVLLLGFLKGWIILLGLSPSSLSLFPWSFALPRYSSLPLLPCRGSWPRNRNVPFLADQIRSAHYDQFAPREFGIRSRSSGFDAGPLPTVSKRCCLMQLQRNIQLSLNG